MEASENLSIASVSGSLWSSLIGGIKWLRKALEFISVHSNFERCRLSKAEEVLAKSQVLLVC